MSTADNLNWYVVHTKQNTERLTTESLGRKGFPVYLPMLTKKVRHARQEQVVSRPLFTRYLFVALDAEKPNFGEIRKTIGVDWIVASLGKPAPVPSQVVELLQQAERDGEFDESTAKVKQAPAFKPGDQVTIDHGPFENIAAEIMAAPSEERIYVILNLFGRKTKMRVPLAKVRAAS